ncbi:Ankyrin-3 [Lachnellula suecica]|uniref:Ankyrin-3 n=1 Tax=Lachnellula suecica TaxID=602035 RepID=A0A8T9C7W4_9HELO|nr:Ankyrin-3 [Lachnellula suecica]
MGSFKAKLKRFGHALRGDSGGSSQSSAAGSAATSTRGSVDERPSQPPSRKATPQPKDVASPLKTPTTLSGQDATQTLAAAESSSPAPASSSKEPIPKVVVSPAAPHTIVQEVSKPVHIQTIQTVPYSTLSSTTEAAGPSYGISTVPAPPIPHQPSVESSKLWEEVYIKLRQDQKALVVNYEIILKDAANIDHGIDLRDEVAKVVSCQKEKMESRQWTFQWNDKPEKVRDVVHGILKITEKSASLISMGVAYAPPFVSLPWAAVGALLPFMMSGFAEDEDAIGGLEKIAGIIARYRIVEDAFLCNPKTAPTYSDFIRPLYMKILEYQAIAAQYFGRHTLTRFGVGMIGSTDWNGALSSIDGLDDKSRGLILNLGMQVQQTGFTTMAENFSDMITMFKESDQNLIAEVKEFLAQRREVEQLLTDLSTIPYKQDHSEVRKELGSPYYGSGQWFLKDDAVTKWRNWEKGYGVLWLVGTVGTGKSSLVSMLLEDLAKTPSGDENLAFFYCSKKASKKDQQQTIARDSVENVLRTLIIQLSISADGSEISDEVREFHSRSKQGIRGGGMELSDCEALLEGLVSRDSRSRITIVIDALDECVNFSKLLEVLHKVFNSKDAVRIFFSSRFEVEVTNYFPKAETIVIKEQNGPDIVNYIDTKVAERRVGSGLTDAQAAELRSILINRHEGMFIWVKLVIDNILDEIAEDRPQMEEDVQIRITALKDSATDAESKLSTAYDNVYMKAIGKGHQPTRKRIVDVALKCTLCSFRPLTLAELTYACSVKADGTFAEVIKGEMILKFCSNFLIEGSGGIVRFSHLSVKHYLEGKQPPEYSLLESHVQVATSCLNFMKSPEYHEPPVTTLELSYSTKLALVRNLSSYAEAYWPRHCRQAKHNAKMVEVDESSGNDHQSRRSSSADRVKMLIEQFQPQSNMKISDASNDSADPHLLRNAIRLGDEKAVERLIAADVDLGVQDEFGNTELHGAVRWNRLDIVERLIDVEADLAARNTSGDTPLHFAAFWGFAQILQALMSAGADRNALNNRRETPLHIAVIQDHKIIVRMLLAAGANKFTKDKWDNLPLFYAKRAGDLLRDDSVTGLLDPPKVPQTPKEANALVYWSPGVKFPDLCDYCDPAHWIAVSHKTTSHRHWPSYQDLKSSAPTCSLCNLLLREFEALNCRNLLDKGYPSEISISFLLVSRQKTSISDNDILRATMGGTLVVDFEICLDPKFNLGPLEPVISGRLIAPSSTEQTCFDLVKSWVKECTENHPQCLNKPAALPTRVIDVGPADGSQEPFLYLSKAEDIEQYLYLSAKRGGIQDKTYLTMSNLEAHYKAMPLLTLPKTYQDAILITRRLGLKYLWIDAYCILQDTRQDWVAESVNIGRLPRAPITVSTSRESFPNHCYDFRAMKSWPSLLPPKFGPVFSASDRGWMIQELVLPERNVIFGTEQIYWNCQRLSRAEDTVYCQNPLLRLNGAPLRGATQYSEELMEKWYHMIEIYSGTIHAHSGDRLPGLSHMVQHMLQQIETKYYAGLWESSFIRGLLWRAKTINPARRFQNTYIAPSWSWASFNGPVSYNLGLVEYFGLSTDAVDTEIIDIKVLRANSDPNGAVLSGTLKLRAFSQAISKASMPKGCTYYFDDAGFEEEWRSGMEFVQVFVYKWRVTETNLESKSAGLILRRIEGKDEFQRVGLVTGPDDFEKVLQDGGQSWEKRDFTII